MLPTLTSSGLACWLGFGPSCPSRSVASSVFLFAILWRLMMVNGHLLCVFFTFYVCVNLPVQLFHSFPCLAVFVIVELQ